MVDLDKLDFKRIRAFYHVAKLGSLKLAALRLNQTIQAISSKVRTLEEQLGVRLFDHLANRLILTKAGEIFFKELDAVFHSAEHALNAISPGQSPSGRLSISIGSDLAWFIAPIISGYLRQHPNVDLSVRIFRADDAMSAVSRGELDVAIGVFPKVSSGLRREVIADSTLALVLPSGNPLARRRNIKLEDLAHQRLIVLPRHAETRRNIDKALARISLSGSLIEAANCQTAIAFAQNGVGSAIVHSKCVQHENPSNVTWVDLGNNMPRAEFSIIYRKRASDSSLMKGLIEELSSHL